MSSHTRNTLVLSSIFCYDTSVFRFRKKLLPFIQNPTVSSGNSSAELLGLWGGKSGGSCLRSLSFLDKAVSERIVSTPGVLPSVLRRFTEIRY